mmetsp:Transcript_10150/g.14491  ORF Transcript_10150/g.14491 Transcript_10150/m.14491 type:complete len:183 (+) Transcript_10150:28-576(+)
MAYYLLHRALFQKKASVGLALLIDFRGFNWSQLRRMRISDFRRGVAMVEESFPARLDCVYVLHPPTWIGRLLFILRPFLRKASMQKKLVLVEHEEDLLQYIPPENLPVEFGGHIPEAAWKETFKRWMQEEQQWGAAMKHLDNQTTAFDCLNLIAAEDVLCGKSCHTTLSLSADPHQEKRKQS